MPTPLACPLRPFVFNRFPLRAAALSLALSVIATSAGAGARVASPRASAPTAPAAEPAQPTTKKVGPLTEAEKVQQLVEYLERDAYGKKLAAPYWVSRAMGVISMAKLPSPSATNRLLEVVEKDKHDVVRLLAWQAVLARAGQLDSATHQRWMTATLAMADKGTFKGELRVALLDMLAAAPPSAKSKRVWQLYFDDANAWEPQDMRTLDALGRAVVAWKSPALVEALIRGLTDPNVCVRAEYVLHAAGCTSKTARDTLDPAVFTPTAATRNHPSSVDLWKRVQGEAAAWFQKERSSWKEAPASAGAAGESWKQLQPAFVGGPVALDAIDPEDKSWTADLELGRADLNQVEAVFVVDATGSMGDVLAWLRRDMARVMTAFGALCKEPPGLGVVFYRDQGDQFVLKGAPLTSKVNDLAPLLASMTAQGGGDIPEAVLEGLRAGVTDMKWSTKRKTVDKVLILIGDAPPKPGTEAACEEIARKAAEMGIKVYACKVTTVEGRNDLSSFDKIAAEGKGSAIAAEFGRITNVRFLDPAGKEIPLHTMARPEAQLVTASSSADQPPGEKILTHVLAGIINPEYRDRVEPLAKTLLAYYEPNSEPEKRLSFPQNTPTMNKATFDAQKK